jgi:polyisoprenoid-binding protein YceI
MAIYQIDADQSRMLVYAFAAGMLASLGHNPVLAVRRFSGQIEFDAGSTANSVLRLAVDTTSLEVTNDLGRKDREEIERRTREEVLETTKYPQIVFESSGVTAEPLGDNRYRLRIRGAMQLHGVTKECGIDAQLQLATGNLRLGGEFPLAQKDFRIKPVSALGGALKVKDALKVSFDIAAST